MVRFLLSLCLLCSLTTLAAAQAVCPALRVLDTVQPVYIVFCNTGRLEITTGQFQSLKAKGAPTPASYCTDGTTSATAIEESRWNSPSGFPEPCDVFSVLANVQVRNAAVVYVVAPNGDEIEVDTAVNALVWDGNTLMGFDPPLPGLVVGSQ